MSLITVYSTFHLLVKSGLKSCEYKNLSYVEKQVPLKVFILEEISMIAGETFGHLDVALKAIMQNSSPFGRISLLVVWLTCF